MDKNKKDDSSIDIVAISELAKIVMLEIPYITCKGVATRRDDISISTFIKVLQYIKNDKDIESGLKYLLQNPINDVRMSFTLKDFEEINIKKPLKNFYLNSDIDMKYDSVNLELIKEEYILARLTSYHHLSIKNVFTREHINQYVHFVIPSIKQRE